jgi:hypothetical protein
MQQCFDMNSMKLSIKAYAKRNSWVDDRLHTTINAASNSAISASWKQVQQQLLPSSSWLQKPRVDE